MVAWNIEHFTIFVILLVILVTNASVIEKIPPNKKNIDKNDQSNMQANIKESEYVQESNHTRVKRQFWPYPYGYPGYYRRPLPIVFGGIGVGGFGFGRPGFGYGRGFGGRGFGGRPGGFGGRGIGGRGGGFGGKGGGFGGRGVGGGGRGRG